MDKRFFEKKSTYSIRKYSVGVCSVVIGTMLFSSQLAAAAEVTPTSPVSSASSATETDETASGAVEKIQPLDELPADLADKLAKAEAGGNDTPSTEGHEPTSEASAEATSPKPAQPKVSNEPTHPESATTAPTTEVEKTPDINHLLNVRVSASNHEQNTSFTADKAVDGDNTSRWATDKDVVNPQLTMTLDKVTSVKRIEIDWDRRQRTGQPNDPNIQGWKLYYATAEAINEEEATRKWKLAYEKDGQPVLDERVNLDVPIEAKYLKLVI